jgi:hypothetical protein
VPKIINFMSTMSTDALQPTEVSRIASELQSYADSGLSFSKWIELGNNRGVFRAIFKSPQDFINKSNKIFNAAAKSMNWKLDDVKRKVGTSGYNKMAMDSMRFEYRPEDRGGLPTRQSLTERNIVPQTTVPAGAARKSVSLQSVWGQ